MIDFLDRMSVLFVLGSAGIKAAILWVAVRVLGVCLWVLGAVLLVIATPVIVIGKVAQLFGWDANMRGDLIRSDK